MCMMANVRPFGWHWVHFSSKCHKPSALKQCSQHRLKLCSIPHSSLHALLVALIRSMLDFLYPSSTKWRLLHVYFSCSTVSDRSLCLNPFMTIDRYKQMSKPQMSKSNDWSPAQTQIEQSVDLSMGKQTWRVGKCQHIETNSAIFPQKKKTSKNEQYQRHTFWQVCYHPLQVGLHNGHCVLKFRITVYFCAKRINAIRIQIPPQNS